MENLKSKQLNFKKVMLITIFILLFFLMGGYLHSYTFLSVVPDDINGILVWQNIYKIAWAGLAFVFMKYYNDELAIPIKEMFSFKKINLKIINVVLSVSALLIMVASFAFYQDVSRAISSDFNFFKSTINCLLVGLTEEIVFRGWAMNAFSKVTSVRKANLLQSIFFMLIHILPWCVMVLMGWGSISDVPISYLCLQSLSTFLMGCVLGRIMSKTHSLWTLIIIHCFWDVMASYWNL